MAKKKLKRYQVTCDSETFAISMVTSPAIEEEFVYMSSQEEPVEVKLSSDEKHMVYGAVLVPDKPIYRNDGENEYYISFSKDSILKMSQDYLKKFRQANVTLQHNEEADEIFMVESWIKESPTIDKSIAVGLSSDIPVGTWFAGFKVNNVDAWERVKSGELKGFSVEAIIALDEFSKQEEEEPMNKFWSKMKDLLIEVFGAVQLMDNEEDTKTENMQSNTNLEEQAPVVEPEPAPAPEPVKEPEPEPQPAQEPVKEPEPEPVKEPEPAPNPLEELVQSLKAEIEALKENNSKLESRVKELGKKPSARPVNVAASTGVDSDAYANWREQMRRMM